MKQLLRGGIADNKSLKDFDPKSILEGMKVEKEHSDDPRMQKEIAEDHLAEDPDYYKKLKIAEGASMKELFDLKKELFDLMKKKGLSKMPENRKTARACMLDDCIKEMDREMGNDVKGLKQVSVAAPSEEGIKDGLEMLEGKEGGEESESPVASRDEEDSASEEAAEAVEEDNKEIAEASPEEKIARLEAELAALKSKKA
jgi:hypothetical protein